MDTITIMQNSQNDSHKDLLLLFDFNVRQFVKNIDDHSEIYFNDGSDHFFRYSKEENSLTEITAMEFSDIAEDYVQQEMTILSFEVPLSKLHIDSHRCYPSNVEKEFRNQVYIQRNKVKTFELVTYHALVGNFIGTSGFGFYQIYWTDKDHYYRYSEKDSTKFLDELSKEEYAQELKKWRELVGAEESFQKYFRPEEVKQTLRIPKGNIHVSNTSRYAE